NGEGGEHGSRLASRNHFRKIYSTNEVCTDEELEELQRVRLELGTMLASEESASKNWYKTGKTDIAVVSDTRERKVAPLSQYSSVIAGMKGNNQILLYVKPEDVSAAGQAVEKVRSSS